VRRAFVASSDHVSNYGIEAATREHPSPFAVLRRRWRIIVLVTLLAGAAAAAFAYANRNSYESKAKLLFSQTIGPELNAIGLLPNSPDADNLANDAVQFVDSRDVAAATSRKVRAQGVDLSADDVADDVGVALSLKDSDVVDVTAKATSARRAALLANVYTRTAARMAERAQQRQARRAVRNLRGQLAKLSPRQRRGGLGAAIRSRIIKVQELASVGTGSPQIIQSGHVPTTKSGNPLRTIILGMLFGVVLGAGVALLREQADRRLHQAEDVSAAFDAPVLTTVPRRRALRRRVPFGKLPPEVAEAFRMLHTNLRHAKSPPVGSVVITSSRSREGKTTVAWNLASASVSGGLNVALVEADLRRPSLAKRYDLKTGPGLAEVLLGETSAADAMQVVALPSNANSGGQQRRLQVLVAGDPGPDPWALMQSDAMGQLLDALKGPHTLVIVDTPPIPHVADAISLLRHCDGVVVAVSVNSTRGPEARRLRDQLQALDARILGVVAVGGSAVRGYYAPAARPDGRPAAWGLSATGAPEPGGAAPQGGDVAERLRKLGDPREQGPLEPGDPLRGS
jgi:succinoglycan biosynthesis transport protein ExoP